jgi:hypothetical protein
MSYWRAANQLSDMSSTLSTDDALTKSGKVKFTTCRENHAIGFSPENYCEVEITVQLRNHGRYEIYYNYSYHGNAGITYNPFWSHPMNRPVEQDTVLSMGHEGDIIFKNSLTEKMIEYILMSDEALSEVTGHSMPENYRINVMRMLAMLWD